MPAKLVASWVFIDTTQAQQFRLGWLAAEERKIYVVNKRSHALLSELKRRLGRRLLAQAAGICVVHGPGAFSAVRSGVLTANLLARLYSKPLVSISVDAAADSERLTQELILGARQPVSYVQPTYLSEPNLTLSSYVAPYQTSST